LHVPANVLRVIFAIILAPFFVMQPHYVTRKLDKLLQKIAWSIEFADTPNALLYDAPAGGLGRYEATSYKPLWMLEVLFRNGEPPEYRQVPWSPRLHKNNYTAISYPMDSAFELFQEAGLLAYDPPPSPTKQWTLRDRKRISERVLFEYAKARERLGRPEGIEYVWLDEFCLNDEALMDEKVGKSLRQKELGRIPDIYRDAAQVCVFCHDVDCDHTGLACKWGSRIFTLGEILHTINVLVMTRRVVKGDFQSELVPVLASVFRRRMEGNAAEGRKWHLAAILQHSSNSGAMPWQTAIHSLIVEIVRRDEVGNFHEHKALGQALNGLLPRRARLDDLKREDGWADLAWLLELNQGFYNAASLAAVCNLADANVPGHRWLGKPLAPMEGNERLEPKVTAFPISLPHHGRHHEPALCVIKPEHIVVQHKMRRDSAGLHTQEAMHPVRRAARIFAAVLVLLAIIIGTVGGGPSVSVIVAYVTFILYAILELLVGTMFVARDGWVALEDSVWGSDPRHALKRVDMTLGLSIWGEQQLVPNWDTAPPKSGTAQTRGITLFDTSCQVAVKAKVMGNVNDLIILAIHGNGVSCMLLDRPALGAKARIMASKVGMANLPPYALCQSIASGTVYVGDYPVPKPNGELEAQVVSYQKGYLSESAAALV
jgi:hypothetical protein